ncbi:MAG: WHG domain-containing protein [bacterium]|nr:WHG domain-containing protein [bacterium]
MTSYHREDLASDLVRAARSLVESEGEPAATITRVAAACKVSVAAPYRHFAHRKELLGAVAASGFAELADALGAAAERAADPGDRLLDAGTAYVEYALAHPRLFRLMFDAEVRTGQARAGVGAFGTLGEVVTSLSLGVPADRAVRAAWALAHGHAMLRVGGMRTFAEGNSSEQIRADLSVLLEGVLR